MATGDGVILGHPPVDPRRSGSRELLFSLMRGADAYSQGAGGFTRVLDTHMSQRWRSPAIPQDEHNVELAQLYAQAPAQFRRRLAEMFTPTDPHAAAKTRTP
jgi:hypothetical protein